MKMSIQQTAILLAVAGSLSVANAQQTRIGTPSRIDRSCSGVATLIQVNSSSDPVPWVSTDKFANMVTQKSTITMSTGSTDCGISQSGGGVDSDFPTSGTYSSITAFFVDTNNNNATIVPLSAYVKNTTTYPGDVWGTITTLDAGDQCTLTDGDGNTVRFYKACMTSLTRD